MSETAHSASTLLSWQGLFTAHTTALTSHLSILDSFATHLRSTTSPAPIHSMLDAMQARATQALEDARKCSELWHTAANSSTSAETHARPLPTQAGQVPDTAEPQAQPLFARTKRAPEDQVHNVSKRRRVLAPSFHPSSTTEPDSSAHSVVPAPTTAKADAKVEYEDLTALVTASLLAREQRRLEQNGALAKKAKKRKRDSRSSGASGMSAAAGPEALQAREIEEHGAMDEAAESQRSKIRAGSEDWRKRSRSRRRGSGDSSVEVDRHARTNLVTKRPEKRAKRRLESH